MNKTGFKKVVAKMAKGTLITGLLFCVGNSSLMAKEIKRIKGDTEKKVWVEPVRSKTYISIKRKNINTNKIKKSKKSKKILLSKTERNIRIISSMLNELKKIKENSNYIKDKNFDRSAFKTSIDEIINNLVNYKDSIQ